MDRAELARKWAGALIQLIYIARSRDDIERELLAAVESLIESLRSVEFSPDQAADIGQRLVEFGLTKPSCVELTLDLLGKALPQLSELAEADGLPDKVRSVIASMASGFTEGMRQRLFAEQADIKAALTLAKEHAEKDLAESEARFREIFTTSSVGMAISDLDGTLVRANRALAQILEYKRPELGAKKLPELFHPDEAEYLRLRYQELLEAHVLPFRERRKLVRSNGDDALVYLSASVLRDPDGAPQYYVTTAEDISDKHLLEDQLRFQSTHDALTGLANRHRFIGRLEEALGGRKAADEITLFHIDLDGFCAVNDGPGRHVGDRLLQVVANRLKEVVAEEKATVARLDADEFGIFIENAPTTPTAATIAARINEELAEPVYVAGHGVAATASIAVLQRPSAGAEPADLLQATDITLRRLKATGRRQWGFVDQQQDAKDRERFNLAASIPGAWESGEIDLVYQPVYDLADRTIVAVQALLRWHHTELGELDHERCVAVLEETGLSLPIGRWVLGLACEHVQAWREKLGEATPRLYVELTRQQASDQDLISTVTTVLGETCMPTNALVLGMPVQALCMVDGLAEDNLDVLVDLGISAVLYEFGTTRGDLACLEDLPVQAVKMAARVVTRVARGSQQESKRETLFARAIRDLVPMVRDTGASVYLTGIETDEQLDWWRRAGGTAAQGPLLASPASADEIEELLSGR